MFHLRHVQGLYDLVDKKNMGPNNWKIYIDAFLFGCKVNNLTENSISSYAERLGYLVRHLTETGIDIEDVTRAHLQEYICSMMAKLSDATVNGRIQAMQRFWNYLTEEGIWTKPNPMHKIKRVKAEKKLKEVITEDQIAEVVGAANKKTFIGYRNITMLMMFFDTMIRRNELITLTIENVDLKAGLIKVFGKGRKWREVAMGSRMTKILHFSISPVIAIAFRVIWCSARKTARLLIRITSGTLCTVWDKRSGSTSIHIYSGIRQRPGLYDTAVRQQSCSESWGTPARWSPPDIPT